MVAGMAGMSTCCLPYCKPDYISFDGQQKKEGLHAQAVPADSKSAKSAEAWFNPDCVAMLRIV